MPFPPEAVFWLQACAPAVESCSTNVHNSYLAFFASELPRTKQGLLLACGPPQTVKCRQAGSGCFGSILVFQARRVYHVNRL